jgi:hypothetical protein
MRFYMLYMNYEYLLRIFVDKKFETFHFLK